MIRISGGKFRGRQLNCPKGKAVRPTTAFVRESLFSILGPRVVDCRFLDVFAGCGIVGVEALSRGAAFVLAIDKSPGHCRILEKNREHLNLSEEQYHIACDDAFVWAKRLPEATGPDQPFDIIYMDPPYDMGGIDELIDLYFSRNVLAPHGLMVVESGRKQQRQSQVAAITDTRQYGESVLTFFQFPASAGT